MAVLRSAGLRGFRAAVAERGGDAEAYMRQVGLPVAALDTDDLDVPDLEVGRVFELAAADLNCPDLGLRMAKRQDLGVLGPLSLAIRNSATFADAMECTARYLVAHERSRFRTRSRWWWGGRRGGRCGSCLSMSSSTSVKTRRGLS